MLVFCVVNSNDIATFSNNDLAQKTQSRVLVVYLLLVGVEDPFLPIWLQF